MELPDDEMTNARQILLPPAWYRNAYCAAVITTNPPHQRRTPSQTQKKALTRTADGPCSATAG